MRLSWTSETGTITVVLENLVSLGVSPLRQQILRSRMSVTEPRSVGGIAYFKSLGSQKIPFLGGYN